MRTTIRFLAGVAFGAALTCSTAAMAAPIVAGDPALSNYTLQYGDFNVVSLQFADDATGTTNYFVQSAPGQLRNSIVVGTGAGGSFLNGPVSGTQALSPCPTICSDAPYSTENGTQITYFRTGNSLSAPDPGGAGEFTGDTANSWDITTAALRQYLGGQNAVFYFNLNENGVDDLLSGTDLLFYMKVTLKNSSTGASQDFYLAGNPFDPAGSHNGANLAAATGGPNETGVYPDVAPNATYDPTDPKWSLVHGDICVTGSTFLHYGKCSGGEPAGAHNVQQNLGANQAAFAGYNLTLDSLINNANSGFDVLQIDWRMADQDNGYEQLFLLAGGAPTRVPEPVTLTLFGAGLVGLGMLRRRKSKRA